METGLHSGLWNANALTHGRRPALAGTLHPGCLE